MEKSPQEFPPGVRRTVRTLGKKGAFQIIFIKPLLQVGPWVGFPRSIAKKVFLKLHRLGANGLPLQVLSRKMPKGPQILQDQRP